MCKVLGNDDGFSARVLQLVLEFGGGIQGIGVDDNATHAQYAKQAYRVLQQIGHHQHDTVALLDAMGLQPCGELLRRSEEHTSELQSLMRISYAVFCLKKKIKT